MIGLVFDGVLLVMLVVTILYCVRLSKRVQQLNTSKSEMLALCKRLDETVLRAQGGIKELKSTSEYVAKHLAVGLERAQSQVSDLYFLNDRAKGMIEALERAVAEARPVEQRARKERDEYARAHALSAVNNVAAASVLPVVRKTDGESSSGMSRQEKRFALETLLKRVSDKLESREREEHVSARPAMKEVRDSSSAVIAKMEQKALAKDRSQDPVERMLRALGYGQVQSA